ncbi:MAG: hypothetical protein Q4G66_10770 [bacterium]|nr:hypothetical protein [bacterium]
MKGQAGRKRRYPQYVLMLDLLMLMLFVLLQADYRNMSQGIRYVFLGAALAPDCRILWYQPPQPTLYYDFALNQWQPAQGVVDPGNTIFIKTPEAQRFLGQTAMPSETLLIAIDGALAQNIRKKQFDLCAAGTCHNITVAIDSSGKTVLHKN